MNDASVFLYMQISDNAPRNEVYYESHFKHQQRLVCPLVAPAHFCVRSPSTNKQWGMLTKKMQKCHEAGRAKAQINKFLKSMIQSMTTTWGVTTHHAAPVVCPGRQEMMSRRQGKLPTKRRFLAAFHFVAGGRNHIQKIIKRRALLRKGDAVELCERCYVNVKTVISFRVPLLGYHQGSSRHSDRIALQVIVGKWNHGTELQWRTPLSFAGLCCCKG